MGALKDFPRTILPLCNSQLLTSKAEYHPGFHATMSGLMTQGGKHGCKLGAWHLKPYVISQAAPAIGNLKMNKVNELSQRQGTKHKRMVGPYHGVLLSMKY
jgi:hypothetical protein